MATAVHRAPRLPGTTRLVPFLAQLLAWGGAAAVVALWWANTEAVVGPAGWLTNAGRVTGLLAGYACAVLLALMARVPLLDRNVGTDRLARWHAMGGRYAVSLVVAHAALTVCGYALTTHRNVVSQTTDLVLDYPDMVKCLIGCVLLVVTGVVSVRAARRRMRYETWHYLHFLTYLAIFLAFGHQLANGAEFVAAPAARAAWYALYLGVAGLLLWYRFLLPVRRSLRHRLRVAGVLREGPGVVSVYLTGHRLPELRAEPGQFLRWRFLAPGLWWTASPYSLSAPPRGDQLRITVKAVGRHSAALARLRPGTRVWVEGPYGGLTAARRTTGKSLLLAGGVGITPLRTLFETLPGQVTLLYRARRPEDLALRAELDAVAARRGAAVHYSVGGPDGHPVPLTPEGLSRLVPDLAEHDVFLCGPPGMTDAAVRALRGAGVARRRIHHESFAF
ncbi:ferric reductase-like transmembrane domain-containing protein [Streptomyces sp. NPDC127098]|uniref:ferredoxin reductase family protein n=1 Tax=Streptomyces sp. NPDC127098 TaxID=3347137 RepID=UPI003662283F